MGTAHRARANLKALLRFKLCFGLRTPWEFTNSSVCPCVTLQFGPAVVLLILRGLWYLSFPSLFSDNTYSNSKTIPNASDII